MSLNSQEIVDVERSICALAELNEPEALICMLQRIAARRSRTEIESAGSRWRSASDALAKAVGELEQAQQPKHQDMDEAPPDAA